MAGHAERVLVIVNVHQIVAAKVDRVRKENPGAAKEVRMVDLERQGLPSARRAAPEHARVRLAYDAEALLHIGDKLGHEGVAVRPVVRRVDGIRVVKVRGGMLEPDRDQARKIVGGPRLIELTRRGPSRLPGSEMER